MFFRIESENGLYIDQNMDMNHLIANEIKRLNSYNHTIFVLRPLDKFDDDYKINNNKFLKIKFNRNNMFTIELRSEYNESWKQYRYISNELSEVITIFQNYFNKNINPDISTWKDVTRDILNNIDDEDEEDNNDDSVYSNYNLYKTLDKKSDENAYTLLTKPRDILISEIKKSCEKNTVLINGKLKQLYDGPDFLKDNGIDNVYVISAKNSRELSEIIRNTYISYKKEIEKKYVDDIMLLIDECIMSKSNLKKFTKSDIDLFFHDKGLHISGTIKGMFRTKLNNKLQKI